MTNIALGKGTLSANWKKKKWWKYSTDARRKGFEVIND